MSNGGIPGDCFGSLCRTGAAVGLALIGLSSAPCLAGEFDCLVEPSRTVDVRPASEGLITRIPVERGDVVKAGQILVELDSGVERANLEAARFKAETNSVVRSKEVKVEYLSLKAKRRERLAADKSISEQDKDEAVSDRQLAEAELAEARDNRRSAELEYKRAQELLRLRTIRSTLDGVVVDRLQDPGAFADNRDPRKPVLKIAELAVLHVEAVLPISAFSTVKVGQSLTVTPEASIGGVYTAKVAVVDRVFDPASGTFGIRLDLPNPAMSIPAGLKCRVRIDGVAEAAGPRPRQK